MPDQEHVRLINEMIQRYSRQEDKLNTAIAQTNIVKTDLQTLTAKVESLDERMERWERLVSTRFDTVETKIDGLYDLLKTRLPPNPSVAQGESSSISASDPGSPSPITGQAPPSIRSNESEPAFWPSRISSDTFGVKKQSEN
ncbi:hypothetical protein FRC12_000223 [Ceratobasidium sp. 428]|nr:hypothetical protein FRC12_000223 [Ceratobasidium sp. 428]